MMIVRHFKVWTIALLCLGMLIFFLLNQQSGFIEERLVLSIVMGIILVKWQKI